MSTVFTPSELQAASVHASGCGCPPVAAVLLARRWGLDWARVPELEQQLTFVLDSLLVLSGGSDSIASVSRDCRRASAAMSRCESPIEQLFLATFVRRFLYQWAEPSSPSHLGSWIAKADIGSVELHGQYPILQYRVDFAIFNDTEKLVVECDGHDFHERKKDQAARDKRRDRDLQLEGWRVFRFTGSEIWNDPDDVARQVYRVFRPHDEGNDDNG